jgi:hypothetical protein
VQTRTFVKGSGKNDCNKLGDWKNRGIGSSGDHFGSRLVTSVQAGDRKIMTPVR